MKNRPRIDYSQCAIPKPGVRRRSKKEIARARARGFCELCGDVCRPESAHHRSRGAGGHDSPENLLSLCHRCHRRAHDGLIPRATLQAILDDRA